MKFAPFRKIIQVSNRNENSIVNRYGITWQDILNITTRRRIEYD